MTNGSRRAKGKSKGRPQSVNGPQGIAEVMSGLLAKRGYAQTQSSSELAQVWTEVVGRRFAGQTTAGKIRKGVLEVIVANSTILQELTFVKKDLLNNLTELVPEKTIVDLRFRVGQAE